MLKRRQGNKQVIMEALLRTSSGQDRYVKGEAPSLALTVSDGKMLVRVSGNGTDMVGECLRGGSQVIFELEVLSEALRFVALGSLPQYYEVPSRERLVGPSVGLIPATRLWLGECEIYCSSLTFSKAGTRVVDLGCTLQDRVQVVRCELADAIRFSEEVYRMATWLADELWGEQWRLNIIPDYPIEGQRGESG